MKTAVELNEAIGSLRTEIQAAVDVATQDERELSDDEKTLVDGNLAQIEQLEGSLKIRSRIDEQTKVLAAQKLTPQIERQENDQNDVRTITVPARAKAASKLTAYEDQETAYVVGQQILAGVFGNQAAAKWCNDQGIYGVMTSGDNTLGGFLVPEEMQNAVIRLRETVGVAPQYCNRVPMGSDIMQIPRLLSDVTAYWVGENAEITASDPTLGQAEMMARKLGALTRVSSELDEDSVVDIGDMITTSMGYALAEKIDNALFNGDGTSTYGGVTGLASALHANATSDSATGNDAATNQDLADFEDVVGALPDYPGINPVWFMSKPVYVASYVRLMNALGGSVRSEVSGDSMPEILGYPVVFTNVMTKTTSTLASTIIGYFGDLRLGCSYGTRRSTRMEVSVDRYFELDQIAIKATERVGLLVHERGDTIRTRPVIAMKTAA